MCTMVHSLLMDAPKKSFNPFAPLLKKWLINAVALLVASGLVGGVDLESYVPLAVAAFLLTLLHEFVRPLLYVLTLPLMVITLTLFRFVINAVLLLLVGALVMGFAVDGFGSAFWGGLMVSLISTLLSGWSGIKEREYEFQRRMRKQKTADPEERFGAFNSSDPAPSPTATRPSAKDEGGGPIIDV
jgi:putative membrane protein